MTLDRLTQQLDGKEVLLTEPRRARDTARANYDAALTQLGDASAFAAEYFAPPRAGLRLDV